VTKPTLSIGIPTLGRPDRLRECLAAIGTDTAALRETWRLQLLVADGRSPEAEPVVDEVRAAYDEVVYLAARIGVSPARNALATHATGEYLVYVDDDVRPLPGAVAGLVAEASADAVVAARVANLGHFGDESNLGRIGADGFGYPVPPGREPDYVISAFMVVPRAAYTGVPWDERFKSPHLDDVIWGLRVRRNGYALRMSDEAHAQHGPRKGRPKPMLSGFQAYVALERWREVSRLRAVRAWVHCSVKVVWAYRPNPFRMALALLSCVRALTWFVGDRGTK
jgi:glycosyltransferase involved in cell wall biosynthesis